MKIDLTDVSDKFNELELEYAEYKLSGVELSTSELDVKFGAALEALNNNLLLRKFIADQKIARKSRKDLIDKMHLEKLIKLMPIAIKTLVDAMQDDNTANRIRAASQIARPALSYLEKLSQNSADNEFAFGNDKVNDFDFDHGESSG